MSADPEVAQALEALIAMKVELRAMLEQVETVSPENVDARRQRIAEILQEVNEAELMANALEEQERQKVMDDA